MTEHASIADVRRLVDLLWRPGDVYELRALVRVAGQQHVTSGYFDDAAAFVAAAADRSGRDGGVYFTMNPANPALLARAPKNKVRRAGPGDTTSDKDVVRRRALLVDVDAVRPAGISATELEHDVAIALVRTIAGELAAAGWPLPLIGDSGNGGHLIYAVDLPIDDGGLVKRVLERLQGTYGRTVDGVVLKVDTTVHNPARISKIYGTLTKKGEDTPERPHRLARILEAPEQLAAIATDALEAFAPARQANGHKPTNGATNGHARREFDLDAWIAQHLPDAVEKPWTSGRKWLLPVCPFNDQHDRNEAFVVQFSSGAVEAKCQHESCFKSWEQLRVRFEPDAYAARERPPGVTRANGTTPPDELYAGETAREVVFEDPQFADEIARTEAEIDRMAAQDRDEPVRSPASHDRNGKQVDHTPPWRMAPELVAAILERAADPWISLRLVDDELARVRVGATVVLIGGSGSGKSSLAACLLTMHAREFGVSIAASIELPADEFGARIVGQKCDASWEDALTGKVALVDMERALALPRLYVLDRRRATLKNLEAAIIDARVRFPGQPILVVIDYAQLLDSTKREERQKVADVFSQLDAIARDHKVVVLALSQMSRMSAKTARQGEALGAESADLGAESAAIERWATMTMSIGLSSEREDGSSAVELSLGKARMGKGDRVLPMTYWGRSGKWLVAGEAKTAAAVREERDVAKAERERNSLETQIIGTLSRSTKEMSRSDVATTIGKGKKKTLDTITKLLKDPGSTVVLISKQGIPHSKCPIWTEDRARAAGVPLVRDNLLRGID